MVSRLAVPKHGTVSRFDRKGLPTYAFAGFTNAWVYGSAALIANTHVAYDVVLLYFSHHRHRQRDVLGIRIL